MLTLGVDLASQPKNTAACVINWQAGLADVREMVCNLDDSSLLELLRNSDKAGIDVPLGWPTDFVHSIAQHHQFLRWPDSRTPTLRYRETDLFVAKETGPLAIECFNRPNRRTNDAYCCSNEPTG